MESHGFSTGFIERIKMMYENATSGIQINGHISAPIPTQCGGRQGCHLSMILFALCLNPLILYLDERLQGLRVHWRQKKTTVVAYADEVSILVTLPEDVRVINEAIT